ncbi:hypothetical protein J437_LFUL017008 [Ladona fulva]|uniref:Reverse transcriptase domain-containing protein n=1 Tax=Ladona fulva TaxID=123851 RepID=A0A8K0KNS8_LADFU|nr:hypothetical protein J437_LFUL017008 [Ladona fulva]
MDIGNWRPIALQPTMGKIFAGILADRIYEWAMRGRRISFPFQKGFIPGTEGCFEHNFVLNSVLEDARRNGKELAITWLDLADAFGSIPHSHITRILTEMAMPNSLVRLIAAMYQGVTTRIEASTGTTTEVHITTGVRQGDPLSPLLFNLAIEPLLRAILAKRATAGYGVGMTKWCVLAYADDIVVIAHNAGALRALLHAAGTAATRSGLQFKPRKCATLHLDHTQGKRRILPTAFTIQNGEIRALGEGEAFRYLGAPKGWKIKTTPTEMLRTLEKDLDALKGSQLAPWQRLDAVRTFLLPRLDFHLRIAEFSKSALANIERKLIVAARDGLTIPVRGSREMAHLPPQLGGAGIFPPRITKDILCIVHTFKMLTCRDPIVRDMAWHGLRDVVHRKTGRTLPAPTNDVLMQFLTGSMEGRLGADVGDTTSQWSRARQATKSLQKHSGLYWEWSKCQHNLNLRLLHPTPSNKTLSIGPNHRHLAVHLIRGAIEEGWRRSLVAKLDQGKVFHAATRHPASAHFMRDGRRTRFCDWRFINRARLNLLPLNGARRGMTRGETTCRRCGKYEETLPHVLNHCTLHSAAWTERHNEVQQLLVDSLPRGWTVRVDRRIPGEESLLRPDIVASESPSGPHHIIDITIPFENRQEALDVARTTKREKYVKVAEQLRERHAGAAVHLDAVIVGALGSGDANNDAVLRPLHIPDRKMPTLQRKMVSAAIK